MTNAKPNSTLVVHDLDDLIRQSAILNLVDATIAIISTEGKLLFQNDAFARFNTSVRDSPDNFSTYPALLDCPVIQQIISDALSSGEENVSKQIFYYSRKIKISLCLQIRPIINDTTGANAITGAILTLGEESIAYNNRHLARMQESLQTLNERVRELSHVKADADRLIRVLLKEAPFAMVLMNENRQILQINRAAERVFGVSQSSITGKSCETIIQCYQTCQSCPVLQGQEKIELDEISGISPQQQPIPLLRSTAKFSDYKETLILESFIDLTELKKSEDMLFRLGRILDHAANEIYVFDAEDLHFVQVNQGAQHNLGYSPEELANLTMLDLVPELTQQTFDTLLEPLRSGEQNTIVLENIHQRKDGSLYPVEARIQLFSDETPPVFCAIVLDISVRQRADAQMHQLSSVVEQTADAVVITDRDGIIQYVNPAYEQITGYSQQDVLGKKTNVVKSGEHDRDFYAKLWHTILGGQIFRGMLINRKKNGSLYYEEKTITPLKGVNGKVEHFVSTGKDITERRKSEERLYHQAHYDSLTDLPNRVMLQDRLKQTMQKADENERLVAVLFLDLDRFKTINDTLGHDIGDGLLKAVAERLAINLRPGDMVSRMGGDEFAIILANVAHVDDVTGVTQKLLDQFLPPFRIGGRNLFVSLSIGITLYPLDENDDSSLLRDADIAMYHAKELGGNTFQFYTTELNVRAARRLELETGLRQAIEREEFVLHYQPLVDMKTGLIRGMEALLRWQHPEFGLISPLDFIPLAEETGQIILIGEWVLQTACAQLKVWHNTGFPALQVAVNLSSKQLCDKKLIAEVRQALETTGLEAQYLDLELTESVLMQDMKLATDILTELKTVGVSFSIDDFGTGYSSLSYLKRFPIDYLKIDRSFVKDITIDPVGEGLVKAIIAMASVLNIKVVAEGVETYEQLEFLRNAECDITQGYYCSKPLSASEFTDLLLNWDQIRADKCSKNNK